MSQIHKIFEGLNKVEKKKADASKKGGGSANRRTATSLSEVRRIPGVKYKKRK